MNRSLLSAAVALLLALTSSHVAHAEDSGDSGLFMARAFRATMEDIRREQSLTPDQQSYLMRNVSNAFVTDESKRQDLNELAGRVCADLRSGMGAHDIAEEWLFGIFLAPRVIELESSTSTGEYWAAAMFLTSAEKVVEGLGGEWSLCPDSASGARTLYGLMSARLEEAIMGAGTRTEFGTIPVPSVSDADAAPTSDAAAGDMDSTSRAVFRASNESLLEAIIYFPEHALAVLLSDREGCPSYGCREHEHESNSLVLWWPIGAVLLLGLRSLASAQRRTKSVRSRDSEPYRYDGEGALARELDELETHLPLDLVSALAKADADDGSSPYDVHDDALDSMSVPEWLQYMQLRVQQELIRISSSRADLTDRLLELTRSDTAEHGEEIKQIEVLVDRCDNELVLARQALNRLADGSHGTCRRCGSEIARARLNILPHAPLCFDCAA